MENTGVPPGFPIAQVSGPLIVAYMLHWGLFGALTIQTYLYFEAFPNDRNSTKCLVYAVYCLELVQTILVSHDAFLDFGYGFGNLAALTAMDYNWLNVPVMTSIVAFIGQSFYAYRIYLLSKSWILPSLIMATSITSSTAGLVTGAFVFVAGDLTRLDNHRTNVAVGTWLASSATSDILIAACMTYCLLKDGTGFRRTRILVTRLVRLSIETGSITATVALLDLALFFIFPGKTYYSTPAAIMPKIYANTMLAVLNSRFHILGGRTAPVASAISITNNSNVMSLRFRRGNPVETDVDASHTAAASDDYSQNTSGIVFSKDVLVHYEGKDAASV
ncbi:hypothetical protein MSAN_01485300 [Mycena sanguinolenta]|uniref:DUF6534 domain-containing protein n=1 Tax=Mycena sanguinolenta TaxID=230812 RepID=A0A8H7CZ76_9AGAR|nr:hypothetical protein MSAN_01485300 [Mycena sanguinolenta]